MSGKIDITNYEAWLLDYFEGTLSAEQITELKAFVLLHPELEIDLNDSDLLVLDKEHFKFEQKDDLFKAGINVSEETLIDYIEGNLSEDIKLKVDAELACNKELAADFQLYKKTILVPEFEIFKDKTSLFKTEDDLVLSDTTIAYLENELFADEKHLFGQRLKTDLALNAELDAFRKTKLEADLTLVYPSKESLKKEAKVVSLFSYRNMTAAAAMLLLTGLTVVMINNIQSVDPENGLALKPVKKNDIHLQLAAVNSDSNTASYIAHNVSSNKEKVKVTSGNTVVKVHQHVKDSVYGETANTVENIVIQPANNSSSDVLLSSSSATVTNQDAVVKYTKENVLAFADDEEEIKPEKNGLWKRAVKLAQQVNGLGVKAVKGDDKNGEAYSLSFNSFSIEKK